MLFAKGQPVAVHFNRDAAGHFTLDAVVIENIDHSCKPLTNMWLVKAATGATFGVSGDALSPKP